MTFRVEWSTHATKQLAKLDPDARVALVGFMHDRVHGTADPRLIGKPLRSEGLWRYRVADYRILCRIEDQVLTVLVVELGHRREIYRR